MEFFELSLTVDLVQASDLNFTGPVKFVILRGGD